MPSCHLQSHRKCPLLATPGSQVAGDADLKRFGMTLQVQRVNAVTVNDTFRTSSNRMLSQNRTPLKLPITDLPMFVCEQVMNTNLVPLRYELDCHDNVLHLALLMCLRYYDIYLMIRIKWLILLPTRPNRSKRLGKLGNAIQLMNFNTELLLYLLQFAFGI